MTQPANPWGIDVQMLINSDGTLDVNSTCAEVSGLQVYIQSCIMRQTTPPNSLIGSPDDCIDISAMLSRGLQSSDMASVQSQLTAQLLRDQRTLSCKVTASFDFSTSTITITESIQSSLGPFTLTLSYSAAAGLAVGVLYQ